MVDYFWKENVTSCGSGGVVKTANGWNFILGNFLKCPIWGGVVYLFEREKSWSKVLGTI